MIPIRSSLSLCLTFSKTNILSKVSILPRWYKTSSVSWPSVPTAVCASKTCWCFAFRPCQAYWSRWDISAIPSDAAFLAKDANRSKLAESIYRAFVAYKDEWNRKKVSQHVDRGATVPTSGTIYKVQLMASKKKLSLQDPCFKGLSPISYYQEGDWYKYTYGESPSREALSGKLSQAKTLFQRRIYRLF